MHSLYRFYSDDNALLYIGQSQNPFTRLTAHLGHRDMSQVSRIEIEWFEGQAQAYKAECWAIDREKPQWNTFKPNMKRPLTKTPPYVVNDDPKPTWQEIPLADVQAIAHKWHSPDIYTWQAALAEAHKQGHSWVRRHHLNDNLGTRNAPKAKEGLK